MAQEKGDVETVAKLLKRTVHITQEYIDDSKKLLRLMGVPVIEVPVWKSSYPSSYRNKGSWRSGGTMCGTLQARESLGYCLRRYGFADFWVSCFTPTIVRQ